MKRNDKIKLLRAIKNGSLPIEKLQSPRVYIFHQRSDRPGVYEMNGKEFTEKEYLKFCEAVKRKNSNSIIWKERKQYTNEDQIITL